MQQLPLTLRWIMLAILGGACIAFLAPLLSWLGYQAPADLSSLPSYGSLRDWLYHPLAIVSVGFLLGRLEPQAGALLAVVAVLPVAAIRCQVYGWASDALVASLSWCGIAWLAAWAGRYSALARPGDAPERSKKAGN